MKKLIVVLMVLVGLGNVSMADCSEQLLENYSKDSNAFQVWGEDIDEKLSSGEIDWAVKAIGLLESKIGCEEGEIRKSIDEASGGCQEIVPGNYSSRSCYVESDAGYFMISPDMMGNINIVFSRWD